MKKLKIYCVISTAIIIGLSIWVLLLSKDLRETNEVLNQCSDRYYKEISK
ncbi:hypothetical protein SAMN05421856_1107 [Chryseobacterium taichungense]|jgi:hypothetical protein|uniref:Uncharacterized protein n=1 Tax=Chryseobacterium taichungense TaxID=295069 RepID=A0A1H8CML2_9FLAO|nr:hypothetical protein SAMN05421856_1107 [Chryseobacterium taichungense]